jgi:hypothetical protein
MTIHDSPTAFAAGRNGQYMLQPTSDELQHMRVSALSSDIQRIPKRCVQLNSLVDRHPPPPPKRDFLVTKFSDSKTFEVDNVVYCK